MEEKREAYSSNFQADLYVQLYVPIPGYHYNRSCTEIVLGLSTAQRSRLTRTP